MKWQATKDTYKVTVSEPRVVFRGEEGDQGWGKHQFPSLKYTQSGKIRARWQYGEDRIGARGVKNCIYLSADGGLTWTEGDETPRYTVQMKNGKYFAGFNRRPTGMHVDLSAYTPAVTWSDHRDDVALYFLEDVKDEPTLAAADLLSLSFYEYDPETGKTEEVFATANWPFAPVVRHYQRDKDQAHVSSFTDAFGQNSMNTFSVDGVLYLCAYARGFNSSAKTREEAMLKIFDKCSVYVFCSEDSGRTWNFLSQVSSDDIPDMKTRVKDETEASLEPNGPCEPKMIQMADGSFFMLIRTGYDNPLYAARSTDGCRSWSELYEFFAYGCLPQLLTLDCGVTLSTFGRPDLWMRYTYDPTGVEWEPAVQIPLTLNGRKNIWGNSCCYTNLLPLSDTKALLIYADFKYPNENGVGVRTILTREITVEKK